MNWSRKCRGYAPLMRRFRSAPPKLLLQGCSMEGHFPHHPMGLHRATPSLPSEVRNLHRKSLALLHRRVAFDPLRFYVPFQQLLSISSASFLRLLSPLFHPNLICAITPSRYIFFFLFSFYRTAHDRKWYIIFDVTSSNTWYQWSVQSAARTCTAPLPAMSLLCEITLDLMSWFAEGGAFHRAES